MSLPPTARPTAPVPKTPIFKGTRPERFTTPAYLYVSAGGRAGLPSETGLRGFEPRSEAPEASVLSKLDYRPSLAERSLRIKAFRGSYQERCDGEPDAAT